LPVVAGRRRAVTAVICVLLVIASVVPEAVVAREPQGINRFMHAIGRVESGGRYTARNSRTGAYGKYQVLPANWRAWARRYLGTATARPTPRNQERVARAKFRALYRWLDGWTFVAHWWLTGSGSKHVSSWSRSSRRYVSTVMKLYGRSASRHPSRSLHTRTANIHYSGSWRSARYAGYAGDTVRYATRSGAKASVTFTGRTIRWIGPKGPTRGVARIYVDGRYVRKVNLRAKSFDARALLFSKRWAKSGRHILTIVVARNSRPVAIDEIRIR
jgi:hypothetical protein